MKNHKLEDLNEKKINNDSKKARSDEKTPPQNQSSFQVNMIKNLSAYTDE